MYAVKRRFQIAAMRVSDCLVSILLACSEAVQCILVRRQEEKSYGKNKIYITVSMYNLSVGDMGARCDEAVMR